MPTASQLEQMGLQTILGGFREYSRGKETERQRALQEDRYQQDRARQLIRQGYSPAAIEAARQGDESLLLQESQRLYQREQGILPEGEAQPGAPDGTSKFLSKAQYEGQKRYYDIEKMRKGLEPDTDRNEVERRGLLGLKLQKDYGLSPEEAMRISGAADLPLVKHETMPGKQPPSSQFQAATFGRRAQQAEQIFSQLEKAGYQRGTVGEEAAGLLSYLPVVGEAAKGAVSPQRMQQDQAERNFVNAILRRESGAAIAPAEFDSAEKQYFARPGDTPEVLAQKTANRQQVINALKAESGTAWERVPLVTVQMPEKGPAAEPPPGLVPVAPETLPAPSNEFSPIPEAVASDKQLIEQQMSDDEKRAEIRRLRGMRVIPKTGYGAGRGL